MKLNYLTKNISNVEARRTFATNLPFRHILIDNFLDSDFLKTVASEVESASPGADYYRHYNQKKFAITDPDKFPSETKKLMFFLNSPEFLNEMESLTGIKNLIADPNFQGGGIHLIKSGGFLNVHTDFLSHPHKPNLERVLNLIIYLNEDWREEYNGNLEFWDKKGQTKYSEIMPIFNRCILFNTTNHSWHGHPVPLNTPDDKYRKSLALYYFIDKGKNLNLTPTKYIGTLRNNRLQRLLILLDSGIIWFYSFLRRKKIIGDSNIFSIIKDIFKKAKK